MRYFLDFEFIEDGRTIDPLSLGLVCEDGRELYFVFEDADHERADSWVTDNVLPNLYHPIFPYRFGTRRDARDIIKQMVGQEIPQFYGYFADYDWVCFCQLFGRMINLPPTWPMYCIDLKQIMDMFAIPREHLPPEFQPEHHALVDARWNHAAWLALYDRVGAFVA